MRNITIDITPEDFFELARNTSTAARLDAMGYLCTWGITGNYDTVRIFMDWHSKTDLIAIYSDSENPERKFVMGAVWRKEEGKFTFHS